MSTTQTVKQVSNTWYREDIQFGLAVKCLIIDAHPQFSSFLVNKQQRCPIWAHAGTNPTLFQYWLNLLLNFSKFWLTQPELPSPGRRSCFVDQLDCMVKRSGDRLARFCKHVGVFITKRRILRINILHILAGFTASFLTRAHKRKPNLSSLVVQQRALYQLG